MEANDDLPFEGGTLSEIIGRDLQTYRQDTVLKMGEEASAAILMIAPLVLRIQIQIINCDTLSDVSRPVLIGVRPRSHTGTMWPQIPRWIMCYKTDSIGIKRH